MGAGYDLIEVGGNGYVYPAGDGEMLAHRIGEAMALDRARVRERSAGILSRWDYAATWRNLLRASPERTTPKWRARQKQVSANLQIFRPDLTM